MCPTFPIYLLSGLLVWNLFSTGLSAACLSIVSNAGLVKKVSFPREILPLAVDRQHARALLPAEPRAVLGHRAAVRWHGRLGVHGAPARLRLLALLLLTAALGILLSATNVYLRDTQHFLELALLAWFWVTPIVYGFMTIDRRPGGWFKHAYLLNPVTPIVLVFQRAIYDKLDNPRVSRPGAVGHQILPHWPMTGTSAISVTRSRSVSSCSRSRSAVFGRSEANFAEEL